MRIKSKFRNTESDLACTGVLVKVKSISVFFVNQNGENRHKEGEGKWKDKRTGQRKKDKKTAIDLTLTKTPVQAKSDSVLRNFDFILTL